MLMCCKTQSKSACSSAGMEGIAMGRFAAFGAGGRMVFDSNQRCNAAWPSAKEKLAALLW